MTADAGPDAGFTPVSAWSTALTYGVKGSALGFGVSAFQNAISRHNYGAVGVFTRSGSTIGMMGGVLAIYGFTKQTVANLQNKDDWRSSASGGALGGFVGGLALRSLPNAIDVGALGAAVGAVAYGVQREFNFSPLSSIQEKQDLRKSYFKERPLSESVKEIPS